MKLSLLRGRYLAIAAILFAGVMFSFGLFFFARGWENSYLEKEFKERSSDRLDSFQRELDRHIEVLYHLGSFYAASQLVERGEFREFTKGILLYHSDILSLDWMPRVLASKRMDFEAAAHKEGFPDFQISQEDESGRLSRATERPEYFPIYYIEPFEANKIIFGFDVFSESGRRQAMEQARDKNLPFATGRLKLIRGMINDSYVRIFLPIYGNGFPVGTIEQRRQSLSGFVSLLLPVGKTLESILQDTKPLGVNIYLYDLAAKKEERLLYFHQSRLRAESSQPKNWGTRRSFEFQWSKEFDVAGRKWLAVCQSAPDFFSFYVFWQSWIILALGFFLTGLLTVFIFSILSRSAKIEGVVKERTAELSRVNRDLQNEMAEHKQLDAALKEASDFNAGLLSTIPFGIDVVSAQGEVLFMSEKFISLFGREGLGRKCWDLYKDNKEQCSLCPLKNGIKPGETAVLESDGCLGGKVFLITHTGMVYNGKPAILEIFQDVTDRKRMEEEIKRVYQMTRDILAKAPFGIFVVNNKGGVDYVNPAMIDISAATYEQFKNLNAFELPTYKGIGLDVKIKAALTGEFFAMEAVEYRSYYSKKTTVRNFFGMPLVEEGERKALIFVEDITERKRLEQLKDEFVGNVSHELRTPLSIIKEGISLVLDRIVGDVSEKQQVILKTAKDNVDRLARIINALLDISKIESGKLELEKNNVDIVNLIKWVSASFDHKLKEANLELRLKFSKQEIMVNVDSDKITQIFINLIYNAIKFTEKGYIEISVAEKEEEVVCSVRDTGKGISKENLPNLFSKFQQFGRVPGSGEKGTGLGLSIVKGIIQMHDGNIWAESEFGQGTKITFTLPKSTEILP